MIGKPYSGKPNVRFDEGELEIELLATTPDLYSTVLLSQLTIGFLAAHILSPQLGVVEFNKKGAVRGCEYLL